MLKLLLAATVFFVINFDEAQCRPDKVICYLGSWANYRPGNGAFKIQDIDPKLCTHLIYAFVGIKPDGGIRILDDNLDNKLGAISKFNALKKAHPKLKTLVAIGGANEKSITFSTVVKSQKLRSAFIKNAVSFVRTRGFNGLDLDWEYPTRNGGSPDDKVSTN